MNSDKDRRLTKIVNYDYRFHRVRDVTLEKVCKQSEGLIYA